MTASKTSSEKSILKRKIYKIVAYGFNLPFFFFPFFIFAFFPFIFFFEYHMLFSPHNNPYKLPYPRRGLSL
jgi:hypothetical protein